MLKAAPSTRSNAFEPKSPNVQTPRGKKRCNTCEQVFVKNARTCPHCKSETFEPLSLEGANDDIDIMVLTRKQSTSSMTTESRTELVRALFLRGMETRYKEPVRARELFYEVLKYDPEHYEARLKASWLEIRLGKMTHVHTLLRPVILSTSSTVEQKQRAYNNMCCSCLYSNPVDAISAEKLAQLGINLDGVGTLKLWENLGGALRTLGRYSEAREAFTKALLMDPNSTYAQKSIKAVEKKLKDQTKIESSAKGVKKSKKNGGFIAESLEDKENSVNQPTLSRSNSLKKFQVFSSSKKVINC